MEMIDTIFKVCLLPLILIIAGQIIGQLAIHRDKVISDLDNEIQTKYARKIFDTISNCVAATSQTYVDSLKAQDKFDAEAQKIAFNKTYETVLLLLTDEVKEYITMAYGDLKTYLTAKIEAEILAQK